MRTLAIGMLKPDNRGFTLIEMLVVIFIIGLIATMAVFTVRSIKPVANFSAQGEALALTLSRARALAVFEQKQVQVDIQPKGYTVSSRCNAGEAFTPIADKRFKAVNWRHLGITTQQTIIFNQSDPLLKRFTITLQSGREQGKIHFQAGQFVWQK